MPYYTPRHMTNQSSQAPLSSSLSYIRFLNTTNSKFKTISRHLTHDLPIITSSTFIITIFETAIETLRSFCIKSFCLLIICMQSMDQTSFTDVKAINDEVKMTSGSLLETLQPEDRSERSPILLYFYVYIWFIYIHD